MAATVMLLLWMIPTLSPQTAGAAPSTYDECLQNGPDEPNAYWTTLPGLQIAIPRELRAVVWGAGC